MSDIKLRQDILDELEFEPSIDAADIGVTVEDGVVTLTGHVPTYAQKVTVEKAVIRVKGVKAIAQRMEVRPFGANRAADDMIARRAILAIEWNATIPNNAVQLTVQDGWVTLTGTVEWQYQKAAATDMVRDLAGVVAVTNRIEIKPLLSAVDVKKRIENALRRNAALEAHSIRVNVLDGGVVRLEGHVNAWSERRAAERAAWSAPGVKTVEGNLTIG